MRAVPLSQGHPVIAGRYAVGELLGRGGMAEVHAGIDRRLDRPVAIKRLRPEMAARDDIRLRFESEARLAARLSHPNAVAVYDTGEHGGVPYIVMELLPGESLADRLVQGPERPDGAGSTVPVDPEWLRPRVLEVLDALSAAHATGMVHRDVKPANILIAADGRAKLADFGIAKSLSPAGGVNGPVADPTGTGKWVGTPAYLAPERLEGGAASARSDIYSVGVVLYEALAGFKPFTGDSPFAEAHAIIRGDHPPLGQIRPDLDPALVEIVERAMATDPERRFASAAEMTAALAGRSREAAAGAATVGFGTAPHDQTQVLEDQLLEDREVPGSRRRSPGFLAGAAAVLLVLAAIVVGIALAGGDDPSPVGSTGSNPPTTVSGVLRQVPEAGSGPPATAIPAPEVTPPDDGASRGKGKGKGGASTGPSGRD